MASFSPIFIAFLSLSYLFTHVYSFGVGRLFNLERGRIFRNEFHHFDSHAPSSLAAVGGRRFPASTFGLFDAPSRTLPPKSRSRFSFQLAGAAPSRTLPPKSRSRFSFQLADAASSSSFEALEESTADEEGIGAWIPIASATSLKGLGPQRIEVMGQDLVVWEGANGTWSVMGDYCPHRLAPLSQGRVDPETHCIECPYHGWSFDTNGTLVDIPQLEANRSVDSIRGGNANSLPVHKAGDLIFAFLPSSVHGEMFPSSILPEDMFPTLREEMERNATYYVRDLPYSCDFTIENFMDPAHIPFAHHSLQSVRSDARDIPMSVAVSNFTHVEVLFEDESRGKVREGIVSWQRPSVYHYRTKRDSGMYGTDLNIYIIPVKAGRSRVMFSSRFIPWLPTWIAHAASNRFLNTDVWLHDAEIAARTRSTKSLNYIFGSQSDMGVRAFRQWWLKNGFSSSPRNTFGPSSPEDLRPMSRREQIDAWEYHSQHCSSCRRALKVMKRVQMGGLFASIASAIVLRNSPIRAALAAAAALYVRHLAFKASTAVEGNPFPSGVADRSPAHEENYEELTLMNRIRVKLGRRKINK